MEHSIIVERIPIKKENWLLSIDDLSKISNTKCKEASVNIKMYLSFIDFLTEIINFVLKNAYQA